MGAEIFYFSGTGNSLYIARQLSQRLPGSRLIPIISQLGEPLARTTAETVGIVFPVHALSVPLAVVKFLRKVDMSSATYVFAVATRLGLYFDGFGMIDKLLRRKKKRLQAHLVLTMGNNDVKSENYAAPGEGQLQELERQAQRKLDDFKSILEMRAQYQPEDTDFLQDISSNRIRKYAIQKFVRACFSFSEYIGGVNYYYADDTCSGCGICGKVCLSQKIHVVDKRPYWDKNVLCFMCYACINFCPAQAVQIRSIPGVRSFSPQNPRYSHPYASSVDIAGQKKVPG